MFVLCHDPAARPCLCYPVLASDSVATLRLLLRIYVPREMWKYMKNHISNLLNDSIFFFFFFLPLILSKHSFNEV